ncbi:MAG: peptidylprolyl isomerase [bacterium]|nr:peptidylprolyl isomerase [bacterium]
MKRWFLMIGLICLALPALAAELPAGLYAKIHTNKGVVTAKLYFQEVPSIVENFVRLAEGTIKWRVPNTEDWVTRPLYQDIPFHRVVDDFVVQTGDPTGTGYGGPGFYIPDEFNPKLVHNGAGVLSMANHGPGTNGSQFFITLNQAPWLDGKHAVFGQVVDGLPVVFKIKQGDRLVKIEILRQGPSATQFAAGMKP